MCARRQRRGCIVQSVGGNAVEAQWTPVLHVPLRFALVTRYAGGTDMRLCAPPPPPHQRPSRPPQPVPASSSASSTRKTSTGPGLSPTHRGHPQMQMQENEQSMYAFEVVSLSGQSTGALCSRERAVADAWISAIAHNARALTHAYVRTLDFTAFLRIGTEWILVDTYMSSHLTLLRVLHADQEIERVFSETSQGIRIFVLLSVFISGLKAESKS